MRLFARKGSAWALIAAPALIVGGMSTAIAAPSGSSGAARHQTIYLPKKINDLDCNGWSTKYKAIAPSRKMMCVDPIQIKKVRYDGRTMIRGYPFLDNGHYVGHDEPSLKFISKTKGSGNTMTYFMGLPVNPKHAPTANGSYTTYAELSPAPWFGLAVCDSGSYPQNKCFADSDRNSGSVDNPGAAGSAFMELQFYPPGFTPFEDNISCSTKYWCSALNIDSLMCTFNFVNCNPGCVEPVNFAFLQTNGVPTGPPSPQLTDTNTFLPNKHTLLMSPGDQLMVELSDPYSAGLTVSVTDLTTKKTGYMVASAKNGFAATNITNCAGTPHTFHAEYSSASQQNQTPWAALEGGVLMEQEIGHFEVCNSVSNNLPYAAPGFTDNKVYETCNGGSEGPSAKGEGPCSFTTFVCTNAQTQGTSGPIACPDPHWSTGSKPTTHCEFADANCFNAGKRTVIINNKPTTQYQEVAGCEANYFQNGDLDYDGVPYQPDWPNSPLPTNFPSPFFYLGPFQGLGGPLAGNGTPYPTIQFETDGAGSENQCNVSTGAGCTVPPYKSGIGSFYPYWTLSTPQPTGVMGINACFWNFGNTIAGITGDAFGGAAEYGTPNIARFGGTIISKPQANPEFGGSCPVL